MSSSDALKAHQDAVGRVLGASTNLLEQLELCEAATIEKLEEVDAYAKVVVDLEVLLVAAARVLVTTHDQLMREIQAERGFVPPPESVQ